MIANIGGGVYLHALRLQGENFCPVSGVRDRQPLPSVRLCAPSVTAIRTFVVCGGTENGIIPISMAGFQNNEGRSHGEDPTAASSSRLMHAVPALSWRSGRLSRTREPDPRTAARRNHSWQRCRLRCSGDAYHITSPSPDGEAAAHAIRGAIEDAGLTPADVDYIERARHLDPAQREVRNQRHQKGVRRRGLQREGILHQVHDRPSAGRRGCG